MTLHKNTQSTDNYDVRMQVCFSSAQRKKMDSLKSDKTSYSSFIRQAVDSFIKRQERDKVKKQALIALKKPIADKEPSTQDLINWQTQLRRSRHD